MCWGFFFQAEDGIRDLVRSRGLGDVYKRQQYISSKTGWPVIIENRVGGGGQVGTLAGKHAPVSYTHLTLPTSDLV